MATREPKTRAGILASGLVTIVATPAELDARSGWWKVQIGRDWNTGETKWSDGTRWERERDNDWSRKDNPDVMRSRREGLSDKAPYWLRPVVTPREEALRMIARARAAERAAVTWRPKYCTKPRTPAAIAAELGRQARRLAGKVDWADDGMSVEVNDNVNEEVA
jgi:hypothetical protein